MCARRVNAVVVGLPIGLTCFVAAPGLTLAAAVPGAAGHSAPVLAGVSLEKSTIPDLQRAMRFGRLSSGALTRFYIRRIRRVDRQLRAVIAINPGAARQARRSDVRRSRRRMRGPLDGIPVLLKDNIDTADRQRTTAGSLALRRARPAHDATVVRRLRRSGAVILGKANLSEWANFRSTRPIDGWSAIRGQTHNPYVLDRNPCGSSSGPAVAVAANLATVAIGTETWGSIMCPAGVNGVVGVKPSVGLVSRSGIVPLSAQQDTAGPFGRHVIDAAIVLSVIQGTDPTDEATAEAGPYVARNYRTVLRATALKGRRIGMWRNGTGPEVARTLNKTAAVLRRAGATVVDTPLDDGQLPDPTFRALLVEFKHGINGYLAQTPGRHPPNLAGLIEFNRRHADVEMPLFRQEIFKMAQATSGDLTDSGYLVDRRFATDTARRLIDDALTAGRLDAIVAPTTGPAYVTSGDTTTCGGDADASTPAAIAGYPNVAVPAAFACGALPLGVSFFGGRWSEPTILAIAYAFEQATQARRPPTFLPTLPGR